MRNSIRRVVAMLAGITTLATGATETAQPARAVADPVNLVNVGNGLCLQPAGGSPGLGVPIVQARCDGSPAQQWHRSRVPDDRYLIVRQGTSLCLDVAGGSPEPGAQPQIWACTSGNTNAAQIFELRAVAARGAR